MPHGWDFRVPGSPGGQNNFYFKHGHVAYQIDDDAKQNRMQIQFSS